MIWKVPVLIDVQVSTCVEVEAETREDAEVMVVSGDFGEDDIETEVDFSFGNRTGVFLDGIAEPEMGDDG